MMTSIFSHRFHAVTAGRMAVAALLLAGLAAGCGREPLAEEDAGEVFVAPPDLLEAPVRDAGSPGDAVVTVDGTAITRGELDEAVQRVVASWGNQVPPEQRGAIRDRVAQDILDQLIARQLLLAAGEAAGIEVTDEDIRTFREDIEASLPEGVRMDEMLAAHGMTSEGLNDGIAKDLRIQRYVEQISADLPPIGDAEARAFYDAEEERFEMPESARARHILVAFQEDDDEAQRAARRERAERIRQRILAGTDFAEMAAEHSDCPSSERGGDLGLFPRGRMTPAFEEAAFTREVDAIGPVVETEFGVHVIQVTERNEARRLAFDEVKERIAQNLAHERERDAFTDRLQALREAATIEHPNR